MEEWSLSHIVAMETIKTVYNFMKEKELLNHRTDAMGDTIANFIKWPPKRVEEALANLRAKFVLNGYKIVYWVIIS